MRILIMSCLVVASCLTLAFAFISPKADSTPTIAIATSNEQPVNPLIFGAGAPNWRDSDPWDTSLTNKILKINPTIMMTPENGVRCDFAHWNSPRGFGFDSTELLQLLEQSFGGSKSCLQDMAARTYQLRNYTACYDKLQSLLNSKSIYGVNIVTGTADEAVDYVNKYHPAMAVIGIELFLPAVHAMFPTAGDYVAKAKPFATAIKNADPDIKIVVQEPYYEDAGPRLQSMGRSWTYAIKSDNSWYDYIANYNWNNAASQLTNDMAIDDAFQLGKDQEGKFFDDLVPLYSYLEDNFPDKKIVVEQWGINDSKHANTGSIFGNTMLFALHVGRYLSWLSANQNDHVAAAIFGGYLSCSYPPTTAIYSKHDQGQSPHATYYETTTSIALDMMSDAFHDNSTIENTAVSQANDLYAQSFQKDGKHYLYIENYSNSPQTIKILVNSTQANSNATIEELYGNQLYSSVGWTMWEKVYGTDKTPHSEAVHDTKTVSLSGVSVQPYSLTKIIF